jgi:hypothetical protein
MVLVVTLFLRFWDKVYVPSSRAQQDIKSLIGEGTAGKFMGSTQFHGAILVVIRQWEANIWAAGHSFQSPFTPLPAKWFILPTIPILA